MAGLAHAPDPGGLFATGRVRCSIRAVLMAMILLAVVPSLVPAAEWVCHVHAACPLAGAGSANRRGDCGHVRFPEDERPLAVEIRDRLGQWLADEDFAAAFGIRGRPGWSGRGWRW